MVIKKSRKNRKPRIVVHERIPNHSKLSQNETKAIFEKYNVSVRELPKILITDPIIKSLDAKEGDVISIERKSQTSGKTIYYRGVVRA